MTTKTNVHQVLNKKYGDRFGKIIRMGSEITKKVKIIETGMLSVDMASGIGGFACGRMGSIFGPASAGKTMFTLNTIAHLQKSGGSAAFIDTEGAWDSTFARKLGVDIDALEVVSSRGIELTQEVLSGEVYFEIINTLIESDEYDLIVVDSVPGMVPQKIMEEDSEDLGAKKAQLAQMMASQLPKTSNLLSRSGTFLLWINQERDKPMTVVGPSTGVTGGKALKYFSSYDIRVRKVGTHRKKIQITPSKSIDVDYAITVRYTFKKNKTAPLGEYAEFIVNLNTGVDQYSDTFEVAKSLGVITRSGSFFSHQSVNDGKNIAGEAKFLEIMRDTEKSLDLIRDETKEALAALYGIRSSDLSKVDGEEIEVKPEEEDKE